ncbi:MAG: hypothetical protein QXD10_10200 [Metallosphaera sp.]|uniref:hypothetical protein n=1 Tax=Metallosphaera sp. TaxID=2020860 RepID=UPI003165A547
MFSVRLEPLYMQSSNEYLGNAVLREFQKQLANYNIGAILLSAPTGSGKTVATLTDAQNRLNVALYPNNELVCSQISGLHRFIIENLRMQPTQTNLLDICKSLDEQQQPANLPINIYESSESVEIFGNKIKRIYIAGLSGKLVRSLEKGKLDTLVDTIGQKLGNISNNKNEYAIIVGTPDAFFLLSLYLYGNLNDIGKFIDILIKNIDEVDNLDKIDYILRNQGFIRDRLSKILQVLMPTRNSTLFIDEYHLYDLYELTSLKALLWVLKTIHDWQGRVIFSSATPKADIAEKLAQILELQLRTVDGINQAKTKGDYTELVRGPITLNFIGVNTNTKGIIGGLYGSSEQAYELLDTNEFKAFIQNYNNGTGRGMVILEKVSNAELFAQELYNKFNIKPICKYSMAIPNLCDTSSTYTDQGKLLVVGTGAKIGQGVEYANVNFGIVARVTAPDFIQSISRIGRRYAEESTILVPLDSELLNEASHVFKQNINYSELVQLSEQIYLKTILQNFESLYKDLMSIRENLLKLAGIVFHYRLSQTSSQQIKGIDKDIIKKIVIAKPSSNLYPPTPLENLYQIVMFRSAGPTVTYYRNIGNNTISQEEELGTIIRNYEITSKDGKLFVLDRGRGDLEVECENSKGLSNFINQKLYEENKVILIDWKTLRDKYNCHIKVKENSNKGGTQVKELESELADYVFMISTTDPDVAEYVTRTGRGIKLSLMRGTEKIPLFFI